MKYITSLIVLSGLLFGFTQQAQAQNPVQSLELVMEFNPELSDSLGQDMYDLQYKLEIPNSTSLSNIHCKLGSTPEGSELFYTVVQVDGSNAAAVGVALSTDGNFLIIDFGQQHIPIEFYANVVSMGLSGQIHPAVYYN